MDRIRRRWGATLVLASLLAGSLSTSAFSAPGWLAPFDVAPGDQAATRPAGAFGPSGQVVFVWSTSAGGENAIAQARRPAGAAVAGAPGLATGNGAEEPALVAAPDGTVYAAWRTIDPQRFGEGAITVARLNADGTIAQAQVVSGGDDASVPELAVAPDGALGVAWVASDSEDDGRVRAAVGSLGALTVQTMSVGDNDAADPAVDFDDGGTLHVAWSRLDSQDEGRIKVATLTRGGAASGATLVSPAGANAGEPTVAAGAPFGEAVAWTEIGADESGVVRFAVRAGAGYPPAQIAPGGGDGSAPQLAEAPGGALRLAWISTDAADRGRVLVSNADGGALAPPTTVSGADSATEVRLAYAPTGDGVATWRNQPDPENADVAFARAAGFDSAGPQLLDLSIPQRAFVGGAAAFSVRAVDVWSAVSGITWLFGDGAQGSGAQVTHTYDAPRAAAAVTVRATDAAGNSSEAGGQTTVEPRPPGGAPTPTPTATPTPTVPPSPPALRLENVTAEFSCIRYLGVTGPGSRAAFRFTLSEAGTVTVRIQRRTESKPRRTCPRRVPGGRPGTYVDTVTVNAPAGAGPGRVETGPPGETVAARAMRTKLQRHARRGRMKLTLKQVTGDRPLAPGTYVARISARTEGGRRSTETTIKFWVLNRRSSR